MTQEEFNILKRTSGQTLVVMTAQDLVQFCNYMTGQNGQNGEGEYLNGKELSKKYHIPYYQIKSRQWRQSVNFPVFSGKGPYEHQTYYTPDVEKWLREHNGGNDNN